MEKKGVISLGEAIVDYISTDSTNTNYQRLLGGATVNVAVGVRRHGLPSIYLCKMGEDETSKFVEKELRNEKVDLSYIVYDDKKNICSVYIHRNELGERHFHSYINETPDAWITSEEIDKNLFKSSKIFYFGSGTLFHSIARTTTEQALTYANDEDLIIAFDANIRHKRWANDDLCRNTILSFAKEAHIVKMTEDELLYLTKSETLEEGLEHITNYDIPFLFVTKGKDGACVVTKKCLLSVPGISVNVVDSTGAGDAFMAALLSCFHDRGIPIDKDHLRDYTEFANKAGATAATKLGSL